jgi:hypothetical protein
MPGVATVELGAGLASSVLLGDQLGIETKQGY